jgi:hypothetical protein
MVGASCVDRLRREEGGKECVALRCIALHCVALHCVALRVHRVLWCILGRVFVVDCAHER